jgi:FAD/FMN-containing dehydrogenase
MEEYAEAVLVEVDAAGADPDCSWSTIGVEVERFRDLHHALQECINLKTSRNHSEDAAVTRLTYPACAGLGLERCKELAGEGLEAMAFGHWDETLPMGIHIFARNAEQYRNAKEIMARWFREDTQQGRIGVPQRGVGKVYRDVFADGRLRNLKSAYDPDGIFNPGNGYQ